ncbi:MAG: hypothetical protein RMY64_17755 [Nostoc sp. DedQUE08]|uniref:hypothetical protein n=1 Tax=Nostoc sp. DedQUE08 TaxID=3075393 RepID=UPI002AD509F6|nr:hypothetical protein [Nostoc sp. DedQUE08]MDZ8067444.1 hypothetical protein [Nostoc sp. DedQUE08]
MSGITQNRRFWYSSLILTGMFIVSLQGRVFAQSQLPLISGIDNDLIEDNGSPNLFFLNPNEIIFGPSCYSRGFAQSKFVILGRGGLPSNPKDILDPDVILIDLVSLKPSNKKRSLLPVRIKPTIYIPKRIVEARGVMLNAFGQIVLSANPAILTPYTSRQKPMQCYGN